MKLRRKMCILYKIWQQGHGIGSSKHKWLKWHENYSSFFQCRLHCSWWVCQTSTWSRKNQKRSLLRFYFTQSCIAKTPRVSFSTRFTKHPATSRCEKSGDTQNLWLNLSDGFLGAKKKRLPSWLELRDPAEGSFFFMFEVSKCEQIMTLKSQTKMNTPKKLIIFVWEFGAGWKTLSL